MHDFTESSPVYPGIAFLRASLYQLPHLLLKFTEGPEELVSGGDK